jgi:hypothetical protein
MTSQIDPTVIRDNATVDKADLRNQLVTAKNEISELQKKTAIPAIMSRSDADFDTL